MCTGERILCKSRLIHDCTMIEVLLSWSRLRSLYGRAVSF